MKKKELFRFKICKKSVSMVLGLLFLVCGSITALAFSYDKLSNTNEAPIIKASSGQYQKADAINWREYVTAYDKEDGDLTDQITGKIYVNDGMNSPYEYDILNDQEFNTYTWDSTNVLELSVTDSDGNTTTTTISMFGADAKNPLSK